MQLCTEHVMYQLTNEYTHVGYVLDAIKMSDVPLLAAIANIE